MGIAIDGKKRNQEIGEKLLREIKDKKIKPSLGILCVGDDSASLSFINVKKKFGEKYGFTVNILKLEKNISLDRIKLSLKSLQKENDAVIVQLPLPENLKNFTEEILSFIEEEKDVDNLNNGNFEAPIVLALEKVLGFVGVKKNFAIVGLGQVVGMPIKKYLEGKHLNVVVIGKDEYEKIKNCDVIISGVGIPFLIKEEFIKKNAILIDYGCSFVNGKACGDFDKPCYGKSSYYTPVPGCMGPLVVASLFENVLKTILRGK